MRENYNFDEFKKKKEAEELEKREREETDLKIMKRLEERETEIVSAGLRLYNITQDDLLELIKYLKKLREEKGVDFKVENFKTNSGNPIVVQKDSQSGFAPIQIILSILAGTVILGGVVGGVLYFAKSKLPAEQQNKAQDQGFCGDGICGLVEKENNVCPTDCEILQNKKTEEAIVEQQPTTQTEQLIWSSDVRLTNEKSISSLSYNNAHPFVFDNGKLYLVWSDARDGNAEIYFKSSSDYGVSWSSDLRLTNKSGVSWYPSLTVNGNNIYVVWEDDRTGAREIYFKYSSDGGKKWSDDKKISNSNKKAWYPDIAVSGNNIYITWQDRRHNEDEIYFIRSVNGGQTFESEQRVTNASRDSERPTIGLDNKKNLHISWYDWRDGNPEIYYSNSSDGGKNWGEQKRITNTSSQTGLPAITFDDKNQIHIVYLDGEKSGNMYLYNTYSLDNGSNWTVSSNKINSYSNAWFPAIAFSKNSGLSIIWQDAVNNNKEIFYINSQDYGKNWKSVERLTQKNGDSTNPFIVIDDKGQFHIVWEDSRDGNREIYYKNKKSTTRSTSSPTTELIVPGTGSQQSTTSCQWSQAENLGSSVNTSNTEKAPAISSNSKELYFFREATGGKFDIFISEWNGSNWGNPTNSGKVTKINNSNAEDVGPFISRDGLKLYFSSNRSGGYGGYDLYYSSRNSTSDSWGTPINLGSIINSSGDSELGPTLNGDETLIFFARGWPPGPDENLYYSEKKNGQWSTPIFWEHNTLAIEDNPELSNDGKTLYLSIRDDYNGKYYPGSQDFDIYVSKYENGKWQSPTSIGSAINTKYHDANSAISADSKTMYFSSKDRSDGYGNFDVYISKCSTPAASSSSSVPDTKSSSSGSSQSSPGTPLGINKCGDGVCETVEKTLCPADCK